MPTVLLYAYLYLFIQYRNLGQYNVIRRELGNHLIYSYFELFPWL